MNTLDKMRGPFTDPRKVYAELNEAREIFSDKHTTEAEYDNMESSLHFLMIVCPEECRAAAYATMYEAQQRRPFFDFEGDQS